MDVRSGCTPILTESSTKIPTPIVRLLLPRNGVAPFDPRRRDACYNASLWGCEYVDIEGVTV